MLAYVPPRTKREMGSVLDIYTLGQNGSDITCFVADCCLDIVPQMILSILQFFEMVPLLNETNEFYQLRYVSGVGVGVGGGVVGW